MILHIASVFGGAERTTGNLLTHLDRSAITRLTLVAPRVLQPLLPTNYDHFYEADQIGLLGCFGDTRRLLADAQRVAALMDDIKPDITLGMMYYPSALLVWARRLYSHHSYKVVASYRGPFYEYLRHYESQWSRRLFLWSATASTAWFADHMIVPSHGTGQELTRRFFTMPSHISAIHNGIDMSVVAKAVSAPTPELAHINRERPIICAVARLSPEKSLLLLLEAFRILHTQRPATLILLGDGQERARLESQMVDWQLTEAVHLLGHRENIYPYLHQADVFVHTCQFEGFGYTMLEALACGTPVVATDCPYGPREVLADGACGVLTALADPHALAHAISYLLDNPEQRETLRVRGIARAQELSTERMAAAYTKVFQKVLHS